MTKLLKLITLLIVFGCATFFPELEKQDYQGHVYIYGELHGEQKIIERELSLWGEHYKNGSRHLFLEVSYFSAQFLNLWMQAQDDTILNQLYADLEGTLAHNPSTLYFYKTIKSNWPETIFHGTDLGHQFDQQANGICSI